MGRQDVQGNGLKLVQLILIESQDFIPFHESERNWHLHVSDGMLASFGEIEMFK